MTFLGKAISQVAASSPTPAWPPGFQSLTSISIASYTSLQHPHDNFYCPVSAIVSFFRLPTLKELSLQVVGYRDDDEEWELPAASSSIEKLKLDCCEMSQEVIEKLVMACRALKWIELDRFVWTPSLERFVAHCPAKDSLERINGRPVKLWLARNSEERGHSPVSRSESATERELYFREDVMLGINDGARREDAFVLENFIRCLYPHTRDEEQPNVWFVLRDLKNVVSPSAEKIKFGLRHNHTPLDIENVKVSLRHQPHIASLLLQKIMELVEDPKYEKLTEVCLFD